MGSFGKLLFGWALSAAVVLVPYFALRFGAPWLIQSYAPTDPDALSDATYRFVILLNRHYWWVFALYIVAAGLITPSYDRSNMGLFGTFVDNPFSFEDDFNRTMFMLMIVLAPGKVVWVTVHITLVEIRDRMGWSSIG